VILSGVTTVRAGQVIVAMAANFAEAGEAAAAAFSEATGHEVSLVTGSTGKLASQIVHGAPFDVFLAADQARPKVLETQGLAVAGSRVTYARGMLVVWHKLGSDGSGDLKTVLTGPDVRHVAIANPRLAPYGAAALKALQLLGIEAQVRNKLVFAESVGQAFGMVATGSVEAGFVAMSQVQQGSEGQIMPVPGDLHDPILQDAVLLVRGADNDAAKAFMAFLTSRAAGALIEQHGYMAVK
jgi:molybdate transport system substrate-binding protein